MTRINHTTIAGFFAAFLLALTNSGSAQCTADPAWFQPAWAGPDFSAPTSNCDFHKWAWQEFLWLTRFDGNGRLRLLNQPTENDLFSPGRAPAPLDSTMMVKRLRNQPLRLSPRTIKSADPTSIGHIHQAGSAGLLIDQSGRVVYYASFVSPEFYEFVRSRKLYLRADYLAASPTLNFPTRAVELKSAWKIVTEDIPAGRFFTTKAIVPKLKCSGQGATCVATNVVVDQTQVEEVTVALVGLHVVGVVDDHPEFIWATFEHVDNAPTLPSGMGPDSSDPVSNNGKTFYAAGTAANQCNRWNAPAVSFDPSTKLFNKPTNVFRQFEFGGGNATDRAAIESLNQSVHGGLPADSVWKNYMLVGGVWFDDGNALVPGLNGTQMQAHTVGSVQLSNSTMETYTQQPFGTPSRSNCFSCHATRAGGGLPAKNLNLSHILKQNLVEREQFEELVKLNLSLRKLELLAREDVTLTDLRAIRAMNLLADAPAPEPLENYADVQQLFETFVRENNVPIHFSPHGAFWRTMSYEQFRDGNVPNVSDPTGQPLKMMISGDAEHSNIIMSLRGTKGTIYDPETGLIGRMPPSGPFMSDPDIQRLANWINAGAPN